MRCPLALLLAAAAGCRTPDPPAPAPPRQFAAADGTAWTVRDGRDALAGGERPYPEALLTDHLCRASAAAGPAAVELTVASYRQTVRGPDYAGPGDFRSVFGAPDLLGNTSANSPEAAGFLFGLLGVLELFNVGRHAVLTAVAVGRPEPAEEPGVSCRLTGTAALVWAGGRRTVVPIDARGAADRAGGEERWGGAVQAAQERTAAAVWRQVWQAVRAGPGNGPPGTPPAGAAAPPGPPAGAGCTSLLCDHGPGAPPLLTPHPARPDPSSGTDIRRPPFP